VGGGRELTGSGAAGVDENHVVGLYQTI
jgi:hypothetical protein